MRPFFSRLLKPFNKALILSILCIALIGCETKPTVNSIKVSNIEELNDQIKNAKAGDKIIMASGVWKDVEIEFSGHGEEGNPIILEAEEPGQVFIEGVSNLKLGGSYLEVRGLFFRNGYTPSNVVIEFKIDDDNVAHHCKVSNTVILDYNQLKRDKADRWVQFWGRNNSLDHCYLAGKTNRGPTLRVDLKGIEHINNHHQITNNHFGPRPPKGGPSAETIQIGDSGTSMAPSYTVVENNLFEKCNGEVEVISSKTNFNEFKNNVFYLSEGSLVTRHGNYCKIDGNYFIGDGRNENIGGIRIINTGHWVTNNYFHNLKGKNFRSPLAVMNGIPKSPLNRYNQVTDVVVAYNSYINCDSPWQFGVGTNIDQKDVLPPSEIRSARPIRTLVANNIIYNEKGDPMPIVEHDEADGVSFKSNVINNQGIEFKNYDGLKASEFTLNKIADNILIPGEISDEPEPFYGFEFESITNDLLENSRNDNNRIGAVVNTEPEDPLILDKSKYGTDWYSNEAQEQNPQTHIATNSEGDLQAKIAEAQKGDIITLSAGTYNVLSSLIIDKEITIKSNDNAKAEIIYSGPEDSAAFELNPYGKLTLESIILRGNKTQMAFASLKENMSNHFGLTITACEISDFKFVLKAYKESFAERITFKGSQFKDCENGIELSEETNDRGDYNTEYLTITDCNFENIGSNTIDYYRGGYDESTIGGNLVVTNSTFMNCGAKETNGILLNTRGIVNVDLSNNTFENNPVNLIALLWGAKNNTHSENQIINSGEIRVEENLKQKLMY